MLPDKIIPETRNPLDTHASKHGLIFRPWGFIGVVLALIAALALLALPRFDNATSSGPAGPVEMRANKPAQK